MTRTSEYDFDLPKERIAQRPAERRGTSKLMVLDRGGGLEHAGFDRIGRWLRRGDLLVVNDSRVIPARVTGHRLTGGRVEVLLVREEDPGEWSCMVDFNRRLPEGERLKFEEGLEGELLDRGPDGRRRIRFPEGCRDRLLALGRPPLPPYIRREADETDRERYQTVYAERPGSIAAPTAGLHFTPEILDGLRGAGVGLARITLHIGPGTFIAIRAERVEDHQMEAEAYEVPEATREAIRNVQGRVVAVGTSSVRVLESMARGAPPSGRTDLFIHPPFKFRRVDAMLTNFHLPGGTPLMLVCALAGRERILEAYREAVSRGYRFYSYGDAMLIT